MSSEKEIRAGLEERFRPVLLQIRDDSSQHQGHAGAREGGHYSVVIVAEHFRGMTRVERHRAVYRALEGPDTPAIHALQIKAFTPEEWDELSN